MVTKEWTAVHRKHHAKVETAGGPAQPEDLRPAQGAAGGLGAVSHRRCRRESIAKYGHGTPDDWLERNLYSRHPVLGVALMLVIDLVLFGVVGLIVWAVQMAWIPFFAAGVINGVGHHSGYRTFQTEDTSTNIVPWGILIGGEELHNNHHAYGSSARLSNKWYEFDIGWLYIRVLETLGLAQVRKVAPRLHIESGKAVCDLQTLQAVITHRYDVVARFGRSLMATWKSELHTLRSHGLTVDMSKVKRWLHRDAKDLAAHERAGLDEALGKSKVLATIYSMRQELSALWARSDRLRRNSCCNSSRTGAIAPRPRASLRCGSSRGRCAVTRCLRNRRREDYEARDSRRASRKRKGPRSDPRAFFVVSRASSLEPRACYFSFVSL